MREGHIIPSLLDLELLELCFVMECTQGIDHCLTCALGVNDRSHPAFYFFEEGTFKL